MTSPEIGIADVLACILAQEDRVISATIPIPDDLAESLTDDDLRQLRDIIAANFVDNLKAMVSEES